MKKIPYQATYPSAARYLIDEDITSTPRQYDKDFKSTEGIDIVYTLRNLTPVNFRKYSDQLLLLAYQEAKRYDKVAKYKFARFEVRIGRLKKGRDLPDIASFQAAMNDDPDVMIYGPGYDTPQHYFLKDRVNDILDITRRYMGKISRQAPYKVVSLVISLRNKKPIIRPQFAQAPQEEQS